uniref:MLO-like protein n=1 Tax=Aegilops tauschii subsp. strangulata TaxID=200361 RepID=A0A453C2D3_AEGTS
RWWRDSGGHPDMDRRVGVLRHRPHLHRLRALPALSRQGAGSPERDPVRGVAQAQRRADAAGVHLADARGVSRPDTEDLHRREPHGPLAAVRPRRQLHDGALRRLCLLLRVRRGRGCEEAAQGRAGCSHGVLHETDVGKVPLLSLHALEQIHIFIFVLAVTHVALSAFTVLLGLLQMRKWKQWEKSIKSDGDSAAGPEMMMKMQQRKFIQDRYKGYGKATMILLWMRSFFKQFYGSVTKDDYIAMRLGFLMEHFRGNREYNFYDYMIKALEKDYKRVVGIKWYYWIFVMFFLLINVTGWHSYFWISLVPLTLLLVIGTKLEHIITRMAYEVNLKRAAVEAGDIAVDPSDDLFWFRSPRMLLILIHFILFQNAYEFAYLFWTLVMFGFNSCIMDSLGYSVSRITICVVVQVLCSYSTLPLYAIVSHMGSSFKSAVFADDVVEHLRTWASDARERGRGTDGAGCLGAGAAATGSSREGVRSQDKAEDPAAQLS